MSARDFFDANILVYTDDADSPAKQALALDLIAEARANRTGVVSTQALAEYYTAATRKLHVPPDVARRKLELFGHLQVVLIDVDDLLAAADLARLHQLHSWDALIVRAAIQGNCRTLLSEDLQHDRRIDGVRIVNPFLGLRGKRKPGPQGA
jgi:predicted nucleic acid-binding protein